jgi:low temperature requirement protein LtrA
MTSETHGRFKRWFWRPPRPHGEVIADRQVSNLELLYDLVYVALIGQAAHHLAEHVTFRGLAEFAVVFTLIWIAWINGSLYLELHGRQDGRTRSIVFAQMGILVLLAVFTADAADGGGWGFAVVYATYQVVQTWLWSSVWRQDRRDHSEFLGLAGGYVAGMAVSVAVILASALLPAAPRLVVWAGLGVAWIVGIVLAARSSRVGLGLTPTDSLVERFGLFTIIVLGELVIGVVDGLSGAERDAKTIITGMLALSMGFGFWWIYFDLVGRRLPRAERLALANWVMSHLPITLAITAAGAGMVSLIGHAHDASTPAGTSWLLAGAVAAGLLALVLTQQTLADAARLSLVFHPLRLALSAGAAAALIVGWLRPAPGCSRCCWWRSSPRSGSTPSAASCAPTPGANHDRRAPGANGSAADRPPMVASIGELDLPSRRIAICSAAAQPADRGRGELTNGGDDQIRGLDQLGRRRISAVGDGHHPHARRGGRSQAVGRVLHRRAAVRGHPEAAGHLQVHIGSRLAPGDLLARHGGPKAPGQPGSVQDQLDDGPVGRAGQPQRPVLGQLPDHLHRPRYQRQRLLIAGGDPGHRLGDDRGRRHRHAELLGHVSRPLRGAHAHHGGRRPRDPVASPGTDQPLADGVPDLLALDQDPVEVEDDRFQRPPSRRAAG